MCKLMKGDILMYRTQMRGDLYDLSHNRNLNLNDYLFLQTDGIINPGLYNCNCDCRDHGFLNDIVAEFRKGCIVFEPGLKDYANRSRDIYQTSTPAQPLKY